MALRWKAGHDSTWDYSKGYDKPVAIPRPTYEGAVLEVGGSRDVRVMSDVWGTEIFATVWDGEKITTVCTALHCDVGGHYADADVDATPEVRAAARAYKVGIELERAKREWADSADRIAAEAKRPTKGKMVVVARGRKVPKGTTGKVFWTGDGRWGMRAGIKDAAGTVHWTAASNLDVVNPEDYLIDIPSKPTDAEFLARAESRVPPLAA